jgi:hypothetical protein
MLFGCAQVMRLWTCVSRPYVALLCVSVDLCCLDVHKLTPQDVSGDLCCLAAHKLCASRRVSVDLCCLVAHKLYASRRASVDLCCLSIRVSVDLC